MKDLARSRPLLALVAALTALSLTLTLTSVGAPPGAHAATTAPKFAPRGELDCNGYSEIQQPIKRDFPCADFTGPGPSRGEDNEHYIGHDEPSMQFLSSAPGSANNVRWQITLPREHPLPATQSFEDFATFWFSMALCEPQ